MNKVKFDIQGMTCSSCSAHVEKAVKKLSGIKSVNVNLLSNNMIVEYDEKIIDNAKIINSVIDAGYGAKESIEGQVNGKTQKSDNAYDNTTSMKKRLIISICFLIPLMYISMHHMLPVPSIINNLFDGSKNAINFAFTQFMLVIPIIYLNRNYFIVGFKRLLKRTPNMDSLIAIGSSASILYGIFAIYMIGYGLGNNNLEIVNTYSHDIYFESAGTILTLITLRKVFRNKVKKKNK